MQRKIFYKTKQSLIVFHDHDVAGWGYGLGSAGMGESEFLPFSSITRHSERDKTIYANTGDATDKIRSCRKF